MFPSGIGSIMITASNEHSPPIPRSKRGVVNSGSLGRNGRSALRSQGATRSTSAFTVFRESNLVEIVFGSHGRSPMTSCVERRTSGTPNRADVPGGVGKTFGSARRKIMAARARSPKLRSKSPRERGSSSGPDADDSSSSESLVMANGIPAFVPNLKLSTSVVWAQSSRANQHDIEAYE